jgi:serine/threonine protein kinase
MIGKTVSHYKILEKLREGGMGVVYKAEDLKLDRFVAFKFLPPDLTRDPDAKQRFIHEVKAASALEHTIIFSVYEIGEHDGQTFIVLGFYDGERHLTAAELIADLESFRAGMLKLHLLKCTNSHFS